MFEYYQHIAKSMGKGIYPFIIFMFIALLLSVRGIVAGSYAEIISWGVIMLFFHICYYFDYKKKKKRKEK